MSERFFRATAVAGEMHLIDLPDWEPWEPSRIQYRDETEVEWLVRAGGDKRRVIRTVAQLDAAIEESKPAQSIYLYVHECLLDEARDRRKM